MFNQKAIVILFINRNTFQLYGGGLTGIVTIEVPETVLHDGEVVSSDGAYTLIKQLAKQYPIAGSQLIIVLSDLMFFEKTFSPPAPATLEEDVLNFFNVVPFESLITKVYDIEKGKRAVAANKNLYETLKQGFALQGIPVKTLLPACVFGTMATKHALDAALASEIMRNVDGYARQNLLDAQEQNFSTTPQEQEETPAGTTKKKSQLPLLLGVFGVLVVILVVVFLMQPH